MKAFDPSSTLRHLQASYGVPSLLAADFDLQRGQGNLVSYAQSFLNSAIECLVVGWNDPVSVLLEMADDWLRAAIESQEKGRGYVPNLTEAMSYRCLAMCRWLRGDQHDEELHRQVVAMWNAYYSAQSNINRKSPDIALPDYINAHDYESAVALYERSGRKPPRTPRSAVREGCVCYVIAQRMLGRGYLGEDDVNAAIGALLTRGVGEWLADGHNYRVAIWMKLTHWQPGAAAKATVLRCYDWMADAAPPPTV
ncbi:MAG: hypothetical protein J5I93_04155 [Pirellulaceae bacterium]|nr:hypothetical protein [Pirellulaceae bacterium]